MPRTTIVGERLRLLRTEARMTQEEFASRYELNKTSISNYENGTRHPDYDTLLKVSEDYDVSLDWIFGRSERKKPVVEGTGLTDGLNKNERKQLYEYASYLRWRRDASTVSTREVEEALLDFLRALRAKSIRPEDAHISFAADNSAKTKVSDLQAKLKSFDGRFARQMEAYEAGVIGLEELAAFKERLAKEEEETKQALAQNANTAEQVRVGYDILQKRMSQVIRTLELKDATLADQKNALASVIHHVEYDKSQDEITVILKA